MSFENSRGTADITKFPIQRGVFEHRDMMGVQCDMWICLGFVKGDKYIIYIYPLVILHSHGKWSIEIDDFPS